MRVKTKLHSIIGANHQFLYLVYAVVVLFLFFYTYKFVYIIPIVYKNNYGIPSGEILATPQVRVDLK
jgi:hypothetical protein